MYFSKLENKVKKKTKVEKTGIPKPLSSQEFVENIHISCNSIHLHNYAHSMHIFICYVLIFRI